jgi:hypothetical protein
VPSVPPLPRPLKSACQDRRHHKLKPPALAFFPDSSDQLKGKRDPFCRDSVFVSEKWGHSCLLLNRGLGRTKGDPTGDGTSVTGLLKAPTHRRHDTLKWSQTKKHPFKAVAPC